jgi:AcrR family transcriptional regulator
MHATNTETEILILDAARKVFLQKGFDGTTMQMIANESGINKALLHYYYRSKDRLFEAVFIEAFHKMIPNLMKIWASEGSEGHIFDKIRSFTDIYIGALLKYPQIPLFILHELGRNPDRIVELVKSSGINPNIFLKVIEAEIQKGTIAKVDPHQLMVNMLGLCIFPFAARPMIQGFIFNNDQKAYELFLEERKKEVAEFIIKAIKPC